MNNLLVNEKLKKWMNVNEKYINSLLEKMIKNEWINKKSVKKKWTSWRKTWVDEWIGWV